MMTTGTKEIKYTLYPTLEALPDHWQRLVAAARQASETAYAPYSHFHVGAALLLESGEILTGSNQENAAYPSGLCAERTLFFYTSANYKGQRIMALAVAAHKEEDPNFLDVTPCGACRQVMSEYERLQEAHIPILLQQQGGQFMVLERVGALLPFAFTGDVL